MRIPFLYSLYAELFELNNLYQGVVLGEKEVDVLLDWYIDLLSGSSKFSALFLTDDCVRWYSALSYFAEK